MDLPNGLTMIFVMMKIIMRNVAGMVKIAAAIMLIPLTVLFVNAVIQITEQLPPLLLQQQGEL